MSEMDDELRKLLSEPSDPVKRAQLQEQAELEKQQAAVAASAEAQQQAAIRKARTDALLHKYRWPLRATGAVLGLGALTGIAFGIGAAVDSISSSEHATGVANGTSPALSTVKGLRAAGACGDELQAEAAYATAQSNYANNSTYGDGRKAVAHRFEAAAKLAFKYNVSCTPTIASAENLTPGFDVPTMRKKHVCADELAAQKVDPGQAQNDAYKKTLELKNDAIAIGIDLANKYHIACE